MSEKDQNSGQNGITNIPNQDEKGKLIEKALPIKPLPSALNPKPAASDSSGNQSGSKNSQSSGNQNAGQSGNGGKS